MIEKIETIPLDEKARESYLNYALSVITSRALPDIRDGLKPVQRRILYAMYNNLHLTFDSRFRKSALVVGEVMGKYHPHGDQAIYDAMVRMAQPFSLRYPMVDGHGNFGSLDGDSPAAMRYTEVRLQELASELLTEIGKQTVEFQPNYDGQYFEPIVLPAQLPNLLLNGATGIAVGMATNIPPHNLRELIKACVRLIESPETTVAELVKSVRGPDFPTGGQIQNTDEELLDIYETGQGTVKLCGEWTVETEGKKRQLILTSIPFTVNKATLVEKIAEHIGQGNVPQLTDVRDESTDEIRVVCELRPDADAEAAVAYLYKHTPLASKFHVNLTCLIPTDNPLVRVPARVDLKQMLRHFLDFRFEVLTRRLRFDLDKLERRIFILEGFAKIFGALDEAIRIIRGSDGKVDAREKLMVRFELAEEQAEAVLDTRLYKLARMEIQAILEELAAKQEEARKLRELLASEAACWQVVKDELKELGRKYGDKRRSIIRVPEQELDYSAHNYIVDEETTLIVTRDGWIKRQRTYNALDKIRIRDGDALGWVMATTTRKSVVFFSNLGKAYTMLVDKTLSTSGYGEPIQAHFGFSDGERLVGVICTDPRCLPEVPKALITPDELPRPHFLAITRQGAAVRMSLENYLEPSTAAGRSIIRLDETAPESQPDGVVAVTLVLGDENVCLATRKGRVLIFPLEQISLFKGHAKGLGVVKMDEGDYVLDYRLSRSPQEGLEVESSYGSVKIISPANFPVGARNQKGKALLKRGHLNRIEAPPVEINPVRVEGVAEETSEGEVLFDSDSTRASRNAELLGQLSLLRLGTPAFSLEPAGADARSNGKTHGKSNGKTNGHANGKTNGHANGASNGELPGTSHGASNGKANGKANGHTNGHTNGFANGHADPVEGSDDGDDGDDGNED